MCTHAMDRKIILLQYVLEVLTAATILGVKSLIDYDDREETAPILILAREAFCNDKFHFHTPTLKLQAIYCALMMGND